MTPTIETPGCYALSADVYHADPCIVPSLSASVAIRLIQESPRHAWTHHPRLNPAFQREEDDAFDLGTAAHAYLLEGESGFAIIEAPDWRTKLAREWRDAARAKGQVPLLAHRWADVQAMAGAARRQLAQHEAPIPLLGGQAEQTLVWQEDGGIWCRARLDWLHGDARTVDDYKTTTASAEPDRWTRGPLFASGYDVQAAFYLRGLKAVRGVRDADFRFVVQETAPPYALAVIGLGPDVLALAAKKVEHALTVWRECMGANDWPGYPTRTCWAELPGWEHERWLTREWRDRPLTRPSAAIVDDGREIGEQLFGMLTDVANAQANLYRKGVL